MARIAGVDLPLNKRVEIGLTYIYGIGRPKANFILEKADVRPDTRVKDLSEEEVVRIRKVITDDVKVEGDLRKDISHGHQAADGHRLLPGHAAPPQPARCAGSGRTRTPAPGRGRASRRSPARRRRRRSSDS